MNTELTTTNLPHDPERRTMFLTVSMCSGCLELSQHCRKSIVENNLSEAFGAFTLLIKGPFSALQA